MSNLHPMLVHFPIALIIVMFILDLLGLLFKRDRLKQSASILMWFALVGAAAAVVSGLIAEDTGWRPASVGEMLETHELMGFLILGFITLLAVIRTVFRKKIESGLSWLPVVIGGAAIIFVAYGGYLGGEMVYTYGAGVQAAKTTAKNHAIPEGKLKDQQRSDERDNHGSNDSD
jgi:uncharacterized membrane protein